MGREAGDESSPHPEDHKQSQRGRRIQKSLGNSVGGFLSIEWNSSLGCVHMDRLSM